MLEIDKLNRKDVDEIRIACAYLFSLPHANDDRFLKSLDLQSVKAAFRKKAKRYHPDLHSFELPKIVDMRRERFVKIRTAYETLAFRLELQGQPVSRKQRKQKKIFAVGGAKGGIGKTMFVANLGVLLSSMGLKTVVVDLDLGGANLHLYLGETYLKSNINDFLNKKVSSLEEVMTRTKYGPLLIGGDSSQLGAANICFTRKLRLLKAINKIEADCVITDLGGDTSFNIIDFFLAADQGIVMTTCDPASYLDAYNFIKVAISRKLMRLFGPESTLKSKKDMQLQKLIKDAMLPSDGSRVKTVAALIESVRKQQNNNLPLIKEAISTFTPELIVNQVKDNANANKVAKRIIEVSEKMLSLKIKVRGMLPHQSKIESSARDLVPTVAKYPMGELAKRIGKMVQTF